MIIIISYHGDVSTVNVMRWLKKSNVPVMRLSFRDLASNKIPTKISISPNGISLSINNYEINNKTFVWFRKYDGFNQVNGTDLLKKKVGGVYNHIAREYQLFIESLTKLVTPSMWLCSPSVININKIEVLCCATTCGLKVPETLVTNCKKSLIEHLTNNPKSITKTIGDGLTFSLDGVNNYLLNTTILRFNAIDEVPDFFIPSIVQRYTEKMFELRVFYLDGEFFSAALFSQKHEYSSIDSRITPDGERMSRVVPFALPNEIREKLTNLMNTLRLNTGSIDMIYTKNKEYVFLEVNPAGQYDWISVYCNYGIDKHIANYLQHRTYGL